LCTKITAGDPLGWSEKSPALGLEPLTLGIQGQRLHHSSTEPLFSKIVFKLVEKFKFSQYYGTKPLKFLQKNIICFLNFQNFII
jgi:hypothetical protein